MTEPHAANMQPARTPGRTALVLLTLNVEPHWQQWVEGFRGQTFKPDRVIVVDSASTDRTPELARQEGFDVHGIARRDFGHGRTRRLAAELAGDAEFIIYMTQDALFHSDDAFERLLAAFDDDRVALAYGRQVPRQHADPIEAHARLFNYPDDNATRTMADANRLGIKTAFCSDTFAAYRRQALDEVGGFPAHLIVNEDTWLAGKLLLAGWAVAYCADAAVRHSHPTALVKDFRRYFDIGVFHAREPWLREAFGSAEGEGKRFVRSQMAFLLKKAPLRIPGALAGTAAKLFAYRLGLHEGRLPLWLKRTLSGQQSAWNGAREDAK